MIFIYLSLPLLLPQTERIYYARVMKDLLCNPRYWAGLTDQSIDNMARVWDPEQSLRDDDSPSLILDASTGERIAHW